LTTRKPVNDVSGLLCKRCIRFGPTAPLSLQSRGSSTPPAIKKARCRKKAATGSAKCRQWRVQCCRAIGFDVRQRWRRQSNWRCTTRFPAAFGNRKEMRGPAGASVKRGLASAGGFGGLGQNQNPLRGLGLGRSLSARQTAIRIRNMKMRFRPWARISASLSNEGAAFPIEGRPLGLKAGHQVPAEGP
jgi:hypothetical protein